MNLSMHMHNIKKFYYIHYCSYAAGDNDNSKNFFLKRKLKKKENWGT